MFRGFGEEARKIFRLKKKEKKKEKNNKKQETSLIAAKSEVEGMKKYFKTYNHVNYFLLYLRLFLIKALYTPNFWCGFGVLKPKSRT